MVLRLQDGRLDARAIKNRGDDFGRFEVLGGDFKSCTAVRGVVEVHSSDRFGDFIDGPEGEQATLAAERLRRALGDAGLALELGAHPTTISLGVAVLAAQDQTFSDLLRRADRALYAAKEGGRNRVEVAAG